MYTLAPFYTYMYIPSTRKSACRDVGIFTTKATHAYLFSYMNIYACVGFVLIFLPPANGHILNYANIYV